MPGPRPPHSLQPQPLSRQGFTKYNSAVGTKHLHGLADEPPGVPAQRLAPGILPHRSLANRLGATGQRSAQILTHVRGLFLFPLAAEPQVGDPDVRREAEAG